MLVASVKAQTFTNMPSDGKDLEAALLVLQVAQQLFPNLKLPPVRPCSTLKQV